MSALLQNIVNIVNSVSSTTVSIFSSAITINYHVGDALYSLLKHVYTLLISIFFTTFNAVQIMLEDLVVFLQETVESISSIMEVFCNCIDILVDGITNSCLFIKISLLNIANNITTGLDTICQTAAYCLKNIGLFFNLIGSSLILLVNLVPRTIILAYTAVVSFINHTAEGAKLYLNQFVELLQNASTEFYLGIIFGTLTAVLVTKLTVRTIRERNVTWESVATALLRFICSLYVFFIRMVARTIRLTFKITEITISNLRVPMFAHAGDSDDEGEDRENLVGAVDESDDEDRERQEEKRRNYELLLERKNNRSTAKKRRGSSDSMEEQLLREVEREREDKLCVICVDKEKCIMILPCRHLCVCESCQDPLRTSRNLCPICRKQIKQMIKAYM